ncbi:MAG: hypothetical protein ABL977_02535 [Candidatus Eisenbacteria bacterium]
MRIRSFRPRSLLITLTALCALMSTAGATTITLTVASPDTANRVNVPITSGVPIATTDTASTVKWSLFDGATQIPVQTKVLHGRKTPWLLASFRATVGPSATKSYQLITQTPTVTPPATLNIPTPTGTNPWVIETGKIQVKIARDATYNFIRELRVVNSSGQYLTSGRRINNSTANNVTLTTENNVAWNSKHAPTFTWEESGPLRAVLRIDGYYNAAPADTLKFTTRMTFYAGQYYIDVTHVIRNSFLPNERFVKVKSAKLITPSSLTPAPIVNQLRISRSGDNLWVRDSSGAAQVELMPTEFTTTDNLGVDTIVNTDANGGMVLADWSYHGASARFDFDQAPPSASQTNGSTLRLQNRLFALAPQDWYSTRGAFGSENFGTWAEEQSVSSAWGWATPNTSPQPPGLNFTSCAATHNLPSPPSTYYPSWTSVRPGDEMEADELWSHLMMYARVQQRTYLERADRWARYFKWEYAYRTDGFPFWSNGIFCCSYGFPRPRILLGGTYQTADMNFIDNVAKAGGTGGRVDGSHSWNGGLIDYYYMTGDQDALAAAVDLGEQARSYVVLRPQNDIVGDNIRGEARTFLEAVRLWEATSSPYWSATVDSTRRRLIYANCYDARGFYGRPTSQLGASIAGRFPNGIYVSPFQAGVMGQALYRGWIATGNDTLRQRLIQMASFAYTYGANVDSLFTGDEMIMDFPSAGQVAHRSTNYFRYGDGAYWYSYAQSSNAFVDILTIGNRLVANPCYLTRARALWEHSSKYFFQTPYADATHLGHYQNSLQCSWMTNSLIYPGQGGDLTSTQFLFHDAAAASIDFTPPAQTTGLGGFTGLTTVGLTWVAPGDDGAFTGQAQEYDLRFSTSTITLANFDQATQVVVGLPQAATSAECAVATGLSPGTQYFFALRTRDECQWSGLSNVVATTTHTSGIDVLCENGLKAELEGDDGMPRAVEFGLRGGNPTVGQTTFAIGIPQTRVGERLELAVFDLAGRKVKVLYDGPARAGRVVQAWDRTNASGGRVHPGAYFVNFRLGAESRVRKLILVN